MPCTKRLPRLILPALIILLAVAGCFPGPSPLSTADSNSSPPGAPGSSTPVAGPLLPPSSPTPAGPYIAVDPPRSFNDSPVRVRLSGLTPGQTVTLRANLADTYGSYASFVAGDDGSVDLAQHAPVAGSYSQLNPMGLFWSAQVYPGVDALSAPILLDSYPVTLTLEGGGETLTRTTITRVVSLIHM